MGDPPQSPGKTATSKLPLQTVSTAHGKIRVVGGVLELGNPRHKPIAAVLLEEALRLQTALLHEGRHLPDFLVAHRRAPAASLLQETTLLLQNRHAQGPAGTLHLVKEVHHGLHILPRLVLNRGLKVGKSLASKVLNDGDHHLLHPTRDRCKLRTVNEGRSGIAHHKKVFYKAATLICFHKISILFSLP